MMRTLFALAILSFACARAQDVPPPPQPKAIFWAPDPSFKSLKDLLLSSGRVEFALTLAQWDGPHALSGWEQITSVIAEERDCQMRVRFTHGQDAAQTSRFLFFESIDTVDVLAGEKGFAVRVNGPTGAAPVLLFSAREQADQAAGLIRSISQTCHSQPLRQNADAGEPNLAVTLGFIADKLNNAGTVTVRSRIAYAFDEAPALPSFSTSVVPVTIDPTTCVLRDHYHTSADGKTLTDWNIAIPLRRVQKLTVADYSDVFSQFPAGRYMDFSPAAYLLTVTLSSGWTYEFPFYNEELANRIAKAMSHAVKLCGGGNKEPF